MTTEPEEPMHPTLKAVQTELKNMFMGAIPIEPDEEVVIRITRKQPGLTEVKYSLQKKLNA